MSVKFHYLDELAHSLISSVSAMLWMCHSQKLITLLLGMNVPYIVLDGVNLLKWNKILGLQLLFLKEDERGTTQGRPAM